MNHWTIIGGALILFGAGLIVTVVTRKKDDTTTYYPGDTVTKITFTHNKVLEIDQFVVKKRTAPSFTIESMKGETGRHSVNQLITVRESVGVYNVLPATITTTRLERRPWYNHLRALLWP